MACDIHVYGLLGVAISASLALLTLTVYMIITIYLDLK
jgi:hypothetical protein